ncbi:DUF6747 family protein [Maribacter sp. 2307ULW6-5]|uniref:DUF6747 family protein n=1 Tax=Maribacter sp. 2307ULW6-5 TaxID=3386275 RepID=UPI0039BD23AE
MEKLLLLQEIYLEAFRNWRNIILERYFKLFSWVCLVLWLITVYAFVFRLATGFSLDSV